MAKLSFSGHESFICKHFWLKKGYDFLIQEHKFTEETAVIDLGVGKNMVSSIRFWLKAFALTNEADELQEISNRLFNNVNGLDPYIEDIGTAWLLHYLLVKQNRASIYNLVFNEYRKESFDFTKHKLTQFLERKCDETDSSFNINTVEKDLSAFIRSYIIVEGKKVDVEEDYSGILPDLNLLSHTRIRNEKGELEDHYTIQNSERDDLPWEIVLYTILDNNVYGETISFKELEVGDNSPGVIFALSEKGLYSKIESMVANYGGDITFSSTAGNRVLTLRRERINKYDILSKYYGS
jgi:hypothetical protein